MSDFNEKDNTQNCDENNNGASLNYMAQAASSEESKPIKEPRQISMRTFAVSVIALVLAAVMLTYTVCSTMYKAMIDQAYLSNV